MTQWGYNVLCDVWSILISIVKIESVNQFPSGFPGILTRISFFSPVLFLFFFLFYRVVFFKKKHFFSREQCWHRRWRHGSNRHYTSSSRARCHRARRPRPGRTAVGRGRRTAMDQRSFRHGAQILFVSIQVRQ